MGQRIVAESSGLTVSELVDLALTGETMTIMRDGRPSAVVTPVPDLPAADDQRAARERSAAILDAIAARGPRLDGDVVQILRDMRDEGL